MSDTCVCHRRYDQEHDWWRCDIHGKVTRSDYEDEYDTEGAKPAAKKTRPAAKPAAKKTRPTAKATSKKTRPDDEDDEDDEDEDDLNQPPDKDDKSTDTKNDPESPAKPRGFGWS